MAKYVTQNVNLTVVATTVGQKDNSNRVPKCRLSESELALR
jgi:hypothetical protein